MCGVVSVQWAVAVAAPAAVFGYVQTPDRLTLMVLAFVVGYCLYTGWRAWKRGWKARFVLRLVFPISLFALSCAVFWLRPWSAQ
jgi:hypothetical protein